MHSPPPTRSLGCCLFQGGGSVVFYLLSYVPTIVCGGFVLGFVLICITLCPFSFYNHLDEEERELILSFYCLSDVLLL